MGAMLWVVMGTLAMVLADCLRQRRESPAVDAEVRGPELAVRAALGAGWRRIAGQLLAESMTLGCWAEPWVSGRRTWGSGSWPHEVPARCRAWTKSPSIRGCWRSPSGHRCSRARSPDIPLLKYSRPPAAALRTVGRTFSQTRERHRARNTLVVVQVALALVLLVGAGLMIRTFQQLRAVQPGIHAAGKIHIVRSSFRKPSPRSQRARCGCGRRSSIRSPPFLASPRSGWPARFPWKPSWVSEPAAARCRRANRRRTPTQYVS